MKKLKTILNVLMCLALIHIFVNCSKNDEANFYPTLVTNNVTNIKVLSAISGGNITNDGGADIISRGVCWSTSENPTITDNKTTDGIGIGSFESNIYGLSENTIYYVRAYATNNLRTGYGKQVTFKTPIAVLTGSGIWGIDTSSTTVRIVYNPLIASNYPEAITFLSRNINNFKREIMQPHRISFTSPNICIFTYLNPTQIIQGTFEPIGNNKIKITNSIFPGGIEGASDGVKSELYYTKNYLMGILFKYLTNQDISQDIFIQLISEFQGVSVYRLE